MWVKLLLCSVVGAFAASVPPVEAAPAHPSLAQIASIARVFRANLRAGGMDRVSRAINACYVSAGTIQHLPAQDPAIRRCILWDLSAVRVDHEMRSLLAQQKKHPGPPPLFLSDKALASRLNTYGAVVFGHDLRGLPQYFGDAPARVTQIVLRPLTRVSPASSSSSTVALPPAPSLPAAHP
jgi:hypothetical protein